MVRDKLTEAGNLLRLRGKSDTPALDCRILLVEALSIEVEELSMHMADRLSDEVLEMFDHYLERRLKGEPVSKIVGKKSFWGHEFFVDDRVLDPRQDSETMIEAIVEDFSQQMASGHRMKILELGLGSGCLLLTLLKLFTSATGVGVDIDGESLEVAKKNAKILEIDNVTMVLGNWNYNMYEQFDIILSNPPYVRTDDIASLQEEIRLYEPTIALDGGTDGLQCFREIAGSIAINTHRHSKIYLEVGCGQRDDVIEIFKKKDFKFIRAKKDLGQIDRVLVFGMV
ncbi:MAG: peptide chain release factor N(5)-glutamine methyltransferase [Rickettsiales bacterium]|nr:peptide chain release factor N(5)-glutamine methyltransferase [Rickettsiales bacterium]